MAENIAAAGFEENAAAVNGLSHIHHVGRGQPPLVPLQSEAWRDRALHKGTCLTETIYHVDINSAKASGPKVSNGYTLDY